MGVWDLNIGTLPLCLILNIRSFMLCLVYYLLQNDLFHFFFSANIPTSLEIGDRELIYRCKICSLLFDSVEHRKEHFKTHFRCNLCEKGFTTSSYLRKHTMTQHYKLKPHKCPICGKGYVSLSDFAVHVTSHTGVKQYVCMTCGHVFTSLVCLRVHSRTHK